MYRRLEDELAHLPGVQGAGLALYNPLTDNWGEQIIVRGHPPRQLSEESGASWDRVTVNYLQNFGMTILRGRAFTAADNETAAPVAIVNEAFVKRFLRSNEDPLEQHFGLDLPENAGTYRIVGVVRDAKFAGFGLDKPARPMFYVPLAQTVDYPQELMKRIELVSHRIGGLMLKTNLRTGELEPLLTQKLAELDPNLTFNSIRTMRQQVELTFDQERAVASLAGLFGIARAAPGSGWTLWRYGVLGRAKDERDRNPHGAGSGSEEGDAARAGGGVCPRVGWADPRVASGDCGWKAAVGSVVRGFLVGPAGAQRSHRGADPLLVGRGSDSGEPGGVDLADRCAQDRVAPSKDQTALLRFFRGAARCPEARQGVPAADISAVGRGDCRALIRYFAID